MVDILRTGMSGLVAFQRALATTGHNITNVNTPSYSRQRADLTNARPQGLGNGYVGRGVQMAGVSQIYDAFLTQQVRSHSASFSQLQTLNGLVSQVNGLLAEGPGLAPALQQFFSGVQDVATTPDSAPARQVLLSQGEALATRFQSMDRQFSELRNNVNQGLQSAVEDINNLASALAAANHDITLAQGSTGAAPPDLLDHRNKLLVDLAQYVSVQTVSQSEGTLAVFIGTGQSLVQGQQTNSLEVVRSAQDPLDVEIRLQGSEVGVDLSDQLTGGQVGGYLTFRREVLDPAQDSLGLLAMGLAETFNAQHRQGMDLDGQLGGDFFQAGSPRVLANANNAGTATLTVTVNDSGQLQDSEYQVSYAAGNYSVRRLADASVVASGSAGPFTVDGLSITVGGGPPAAGDRFLIQPTREGAADFALAVADARQIAAAVPIRTRADPANLGSASISAGTVQEVTHPDLRRAVEIRFTTPTQFDVIDTTTHTALAVGQPYVSDAPIAFNGWEVCISGVPQAADTFQVTDNAGGAGDNRNALALAGLPSSQMLLNGSSDYQDVYAQLVAQVGAQGQRTENALQSQEVLLTQVTEARDAVSGVNLDEEAADLLRFQQAYEASAQLIRTADSLFETLLGALRR